MEGHLLLPYTAKKFEWTHQTTIREEFQTITNQRGTKIPIPPRRYAVEITAISKHNTITKNQIEKIKQMVTTVHSYSYAPEPLHQIESVFQLLDKKRNGEHLIIYLTNISSQTIRREIYLQTLEILHQYKTETTWIQQMADTEHPRAYSTLITDQVIQVILQRAETVAHMTWQYPPRPPWTLQMAPAILIHHKALQTQTPAKPQRTIPQTPRKKTSQPATTPSSSTNQTKTLNGKQQQETNQAQHSSHSTMETITTSYSQQTTEEETDPDSETISGYLGATTAGHAEINSTYSKIHYLRRYILYCIRNGISTARLHGTRIGETMKEAFNIFNDLYHNRDPNTIDEELKECKK
jgi:hypothetical protein